MIEIENDAIEDLSSQEVQIVDLKTPKAVKQNEQSSS